MPQLDPNIAIQALAVIVQSVLACISLLTLLGTLGFFYVQSKALLEQSREQTIATRATIYQNLTSMMIDIDKYFIDNPELKPYFYDKQDISEKDPLYGKVESIAEMIIDFLDFVLSHKEYMSKPDWEEWELYAQYVYVKSPVLKRYWVANKKWWMPELEPLFARAETDLTKAGRMD